MYLVVLLALMVNLEALRRPVRSRALGLYLAANVALGVLLVTVPAVRRYAFGLAIRAGQVVELGWRNLPAGRSLTAAGVVRRHVRFAARAAARSRAAFALASTCSFHRCPAWALTHFVTAPLVTATSRKADESAAYFAGRGVNVPAATSSATRQSLINTTRWVKCHRCSTTSSSADRAASSSITRLVVFEAEPSRSHSTSSSRTMTKAHPPGRPTRSSAEPSQ